MPTDTDQGLINSLGTLNCTGEDRNTPECADYCFNNSTAPECTDCSTLTEIEKEEYPYCQDEETAKYCEAIANDGNGSSWLKTLAGIVNVSGACLEGYTMDTTEGAPIRNCSLSGTWGGITSGACISEISECDNSLLGIDMPHTIFPNMTGTTPVSETQTATECETGYVKTGSITAECLSDGTWGYSTTGLCVEACSGSELPSLIDKTYQESWYVCQFNNISCTSDGSVSLADQLYPKNTYVYLNNCDTGYMRSGAAIYKCTGIDTWSVETSASCVGQRLDQSLEEGSTSIWRTNIWQSFTPSMDGYLSQVSVNGTLGNSQAFYVYAGEGTGGTLLHTQSLISLYSGSDWTDIILSTPIYISKDLKYTFRITASGTEGSPTSNLYRWDGDYSGGMSSMGINDIQFRTYMIPWPPVE